MGMNISFVCLKLGTLSPPSVVAGGCRSEWSGDVCGAEQD